MKNKGGFVAALTLAGLLYSPFLPVNAQTTPPPPAHGTGQFVLEVNDQETADHMSGDRFSIGEHTFVTVKDQQTANQYQGDPNVLSIEPQHTRHITNTPNDPYFNDPISGESQWHHYQSNDIDIDSTDAWDALTDASTVVVAVVDSGVDLDHADLAANIWVNSGEIAGNGIDDDGNRFEDDVNGWDFTNNDNDPNPAPDGVDNDGDLEVDGGVVHGTHVAGLIGAVGNNGVGVTGVAWNVQIMAVRALDDEGSGTDEDLAQAMKYAADNGADIINLSLGGYGNDSILQAGVDYAQAAGVLVVAAAGNDTTNLNSDPFYPACSDSVLGVASTNAADEASYFSNFGTDCVDIASPGSSMLSTLYTDDPAYSFTDDYGYLSGTSMATPVISGAAAILLAANPTFSASDLTSALTSTVDDIGLGDEYGSGRLNVASALENAISLPTMSAWETASSTGQIDSGERTTETTPYFTWTEGFDPDGIAGYWVSFGKNSNVDPASEGTFQTTQNFSPTTTFSGNDQAYYLRIKIQDVDGDISHAAGTFEYVFDNKVARPDTFELSVVQGGLRLDWTKVSGDHVSSYQVRRSLHNQNKFKTVTTLTSSKAYYVDQSVVSEKNYDYRLKVIDNLDNSASTAKKNKVFYGIEWLAMGAGPGFAPKVVVYDTNTSKVKSSFSAYPSSMTQGVEVATGDVDGDGIDEIITGTGDGAVAEVRVFELDGTQIGNWFPYSATSTTGVRVGTADTDKDGIYEVVTVPGPGATPLVRRFTKNGSHLGTDFYALDGKFKGGAFISGVDFDGNGKDELAIGAGPGGGAQVTVNNPNTGEIKANFFAYDQYTFKGGIRVSRADTDGQGGEEVVAVPAVGTSHTQMFSRVPGAVNQLNPGFFAYDTAYTSGFNISALDITQDGQDELAIGTGPGMYSEVALYDKTGETLLALAYPFDAFVGAHVAGGYFGQ